LAEKKSDGTIYQTGGMVKEFHRHRKIPKKPMQKSCGSCQNYIKFKNRHLCRGICNLIDCGATSDSGKNCAMWKGIPYKREKQQEVFVS